MACKFSVSGINYDIDYLSLLLNLLPPEKRPEAFRLGAKKSVVCPYRGQSHIFFRYAIKSHFEKEKLRCLKISIRNFCHMTGCLSHMNTAGYFDCFSLHDSDCLM